MELDNVMHVGILFAGPWIQPDDWIGKENITLHINYYLCQYDNDFACDWMVFTTADHVIPARKYYCTCNKRCPINQRNATKHMKKKFWKKRKRNRRIYSEILMIKINDFLFVKLFDDNAWIQLKTQNDKLHW